MYFRCQLVVSFMLLFLKLKPYEKNAENPGDNLQIRGSLKMNQDKWQPLLFVITHYRKLIILFFV